MTYNQEQPLDLNAYYQAVPRWARGYEWDGMWTTTSGSIDSDATTPTYINSDAADASLSCSDGSDEAECTWLDEEDLLSSMSLMAKCFGIWKSCTNNNRGSVYRKQKLAHRRLAYLLA